MLKKVLWATAAFGLVACAVKNVATTTSIAEETAVRAPAAIANETIWKKYCIAKAADSVEIPKVNYSNSLVKSAAGVLNKIAPKSFYNYSAVIKAYGLKGGVNGPAPATADAPAGTTNATHNFLVTLCGEFRDRATMVEAKLKWITQTNKLPVKDSSKPIDLSKNIWMQMTASQYAPYIEISEQIFLLKRADEAKKGNEFINFEKSKVQEDIEFPVNGQTVCETKFIFAELLKKNVKKVTDYAAYKVKYDKFEAKCSEDDKNYLHVFRGDSNFKSYSPESNGMIWQGKSLAANCKTLSTAVADENLNTITTDSDCKKYFKSPFLNRWGSARSAVGTWMLRDPKHDAVFADDKKQTFMIFRRSAEPSPYSFKFTQDPNESYSDFIAGWDWKKADMGFNAIAAKMPNPHDFKYNRLRDAVNRHTQWFASGIYDNSVVERELIIKNSEPIEYKQHVVDNYSPFVASSYVMKASDSFTSPEYSMSIEGDGRKHWMYIFRVHKDNWYTPLSVKNNVAVNFDKHWLDETSFGTNKLADEERAFDRMGTPMEAELDSIIYLHNIEVGGKISDDGL